MAVIECLRQGGIEEFFPVHVWHRPVAESDQRYIAPPYAMVRIYPSTGQMEGPLNDSQADVTIRIQILGVGVTEDHALIVTDLCRPHMQRRKIFIEGRRVMDCGLMVGSGGATRDDDLPTPFFYSTDLYELRTTPSIEEE